MQKNGFKKHLWALFRVNFFMFVLLISNHTVFLVQFEVNLRLWVFQKPEIALAEVARAISAFLKNSLVQSNSKLNEKNRMITYTNHTSKNRPKSEKNHLLNKASNEGELSDLIRFYRLFWFWNMKSLSSYPTEWLSHHLYTIHRWKKERREKMITVVILHKRLQRSKAKQLGSTGLTCPRYRWSLWLPCLQQGDQNQKHMSYMIYGWLKFSVRHSALWLWVWQITPAAAFVVLCSSWACSL